jgi:hypothetical protein
VEATLSKIETINIPEVSKAKLDWPIIRIPANNLHSVLESRGQVCYKFSGENCFYELEPAEVKFSPAVIQTGGRNYSFAEREIVCYQYKTDAVCRFENFFKFCKSDPVLKQVESGLNVSQNSDADRSWVVLVSASGFDNIYESEIFKWAKNLRAEIIDPETSKPVRVNIERER